MGTKRALFENSALFVPPMEHRRETAETALYKGVLHMDGYRITEKQTEAFRQHLRAEERGEGTVEKYLRDVRAFAVWLGKRSVDRTAVADWKACLLDQGYAPVTVNSMLAALHSFFAFAGWTECRARYLTVQKKLFRDVSKELTRAEYERLLGAARSRGRERLALVIETICGTGIRVGEVKYITVEAARRGRVEIALKGKIRTILLPSRLCRKLLKYAGKKSITSGEIFLTGTGRGLSRRQIWAELKSLCRHAGVKASKVFPHNLRHLFATTFYRVSKDIVQLANILGHSSVETTRIYLATSGLEHARRLDRLGLIQ